MQLSALYLRWPLLFIWLLAIPFLTVPATYSAMQYLDRRAQCELVPGSTKTAPPESSFSCPIALSLATHAPGVLNLLPVLWLGLPLGRARRAVVFATSIGAARLIVPALPIAAGAPLRCGVVGCTFGPPTWWVWGLVGWGVTAVGLGLALWLLRHDVSAPVPTVGSTQIPDSGARGRTKTVQLVTGVVFVLAGMLICAIGPLSPFGNAGAITLLPWLLVGGAMLWLGVRESLAAREMY